MQAMVNKMRGKKGQLKTKKTGSFLAFNCLKSKKAQLKIQQMAFMLMAVTLFFALVGMFVLAIKFSGLKETAATLCEENAMMLVTKLANSPEFSCGEAFDGETNCIDGDKIMMLKENIDAYEDFWGASNIEIRKIYPAEAEKVCDIGTYQGGDCNTIRLISKNVSGFDDKYNFVSLCRKEYIDGDMYDKCEIARLSVRYNYNERC